MVLASYASVAPHMNNILQESGVLVCLCLFLLLSHVLKPRPPSEQNGRRACQAALSLRVCHCQRELRGQMVPSLGVSFYDTFDH